MTCINNYKNSYSNVVDYPRVLGSFADDYTGGSACVLPYKIINTFHDKSAKDFITPARCEFSHPANPDRIVKLDPTDTGCRIDFSNKSRDEMRRQLEVIQALYDKNVVEKRLALEALLNYEYESLRITQSNFDTKKRALDETTSAYVRAVADSNALVRERDLLRSTQMSVAAQLKQVKMDISDARNQAEIVVDNVNKTIKTADDFLNFVAVCEHVNYDGTKVTLRPQIYKWTNFGMSSIIIPPGMTARIWVGENYDGASEKLDHTTSKRTNFVELKFKETKYKEEFTQQGKSQPQIEEFKNRRSDHRKSDHHKSNRNKSLRQRYVETIEKIQAASSEDATPPPKKKQVPYEAEGNFNDRVACIEIQKEQSVGEWMDTWQRDL